MIDKISWKYEYCTVNYSLTEEAEILEHEDNEFCFNSPLMLNCFLIDFSSSLYLLLTLIFPFYINKYLCSFFILFELLQNFIWTILNFLTLSKYYYSSIFIISIVAWVRNDTSQITRIWSPPNLLHHSFSCTTIEICPAEKIQILQPR